MKNRILKSLLVSSLAFGAFMSDGNTFSRDTGRFSRSALSRPAANPSYTPTPKEIVPAPANVPSTDTASGSGSSDKEVVGVPPAETPVVPQKKSEDYLLHGPDTAGLGSSDKAGGSAALKGNSMPAPTQVPPVAPLTTGSTATPTSTSSKTIKDLERSFNVVMSSSDSNKIDTLKLCISKSEKVFNALLEELSTAEKSKTLVATLQTQLAEAKKSGETVKTLQTRIAELEETVKNAPADSSLQDLKDLLMALSEKEETVLNDLVFESFDRKNGVLKERIKEFSINPSEFILSITDAKANGTIDKFLKDQPAVFAKELGTQTKEFVKLLSGVFGIKVGSVSIAEYNEALKAAVTEANANAEKALLEANAGKVKAEKALIDAKDEIEAAYEEAKTKAAKELEAAVTDKLDAVKALTDAKTEIEAANAAELKLIGGMVNALELIPGEVTIIFDGGGSTDIAKGDLAATLQRSVWDRNPKGFFEARDEKEMMDVIKFVLGEAEIEGKKITDVHKK